MRTISTRTTGGFVILCHVLASPVHGFSFLGRPSPLGARLSASSTNSDIADKTLASTSDPEALGTSGDWSAYLDESKGLIYYFNQRTGESTWEAPKYVDFSNVQLSASRKAEMRERLTNYLKDRMNSSSATADFLGALHDDDHHDGENPRIKKTKLAVESSTKQNQAANQTNCIVSNWKEWQEVMDNKRGKMYYYNKNTRCSQWERPSGFPDPESSSKEENMDCVDNEMDVDLKLVDGESKKAKQATRPVLKKSTQDLSVDANFSNEQSSSSRIKFDASSTRPSEVKTEKRTVNNVLGNKDEIEEQPDVNSLPIVEKGEWSAHFDIKTGVVFYYNEISGVTSWDPPFKDFPRIVMENTVPKVLDPSSSNISMERALGYSNVGVDETAEALAWEEAKKREKARKAKLRALEAEAQVKEAKKGSTTPNQSKTKSIDVIYATAKNAELDRLEQKRESNKTAAREQTSRLESEQFRPERAAAGEKESTEQEATFIAADEEVKQERIENSRREKERLEEEKKLKLKMQNERIAAELLASREQMAAAELAIEETLEQERLEKVEEKKKVHSPELPKGDPTFTVETAGAMVAPLKNRSLYDMLQCSNSASRAELKRSYLSLAKMSHPDALIQQGMAKNDQTETRFAEISHAWKILGDPILRRRYDRELQAKGVSSKAGTLFENWVIGAAKVMDEALAKAEHDLNSGGGKNP